MLWDYFRLAFSGLRAHSKRTLLTMIGIFIGIAAVVSLISLGQGMQEAVNAQFASIGADKIIVQAKSAGFGPPGSTSAGKVTYDDLRTLERVKGINEVAGRLLKSVNVKFNEKARTQFVTTLPNGPEAALIIDANNYKIAEGRMLKPSDKGKIVIGNALAKKEKFGKVLKVGNKLILNGKQYKIVGITTPMGDPARGNAILLNEQDAWALFGITDKELSVLVARVSTGEKPNRIAEAVQKAFRRQRNEKKGRETIQVETSGQVIESFNAILNVVQAVLIGIALISLLVGGIGIMNTMYTSVLERTKQIGIMKAIGARNADILLLFIIESGILGFVGGIIGIALGMGMSFMVELGARYAFGPNLLQAYFPWYLIIGAMAFSFIIGMISGVLPARQASALKPVDALRYG